MRFLLCLLASGVLLPELGAEPPPPGLAAPRYYFLLFGSDAGRIRLARNHTFGTFVRATPCLDGSVRLDVVTISWLAADRRTNALLPFRPEPGHNYELHETLRLVLGQRQGVALWGPYETDAGRFEAAAARAAVLASGVVRYRAVDSIRPRPGVSHCVHGLTRADPVLGWETQPAYRIGRWGTRTLAGKYAATGAFLDPCTTHDWLIPALGLDHYPITRHK